MKKKQILIYTLSIMLVGLFVFYSKNSMEAALDAIYVCGKTVIPSLFPFFVLSSFMISTGFVKVLGTLVKPLAKRVFRISGSGAIVFVMGILCGYPTGAKMTAELYKDKQISKEEAVRLLPFCNNSGPLFVIGAVGTSMLGNTKIGITLYVIHVLSAVISGIVFAFFSKKPQSSDKELFINTSLGHAFSNAVSSGVHAILEVCGYIVFFSVIRRFLLPVIRFFLGRNIFALFVSSLSEVTMGAVDICNGNLPLYGTIILLSGTIGFGGICVFLQVMGIAGQVGLPVKSYLFGKLFQSVVAMLVAAVYLKYRETSYVFLNFTEMTCRYIPVLPCILFAFFCLFAYAAVIRKN